MKTFAKITLTVNILKQAGRYIAYSPALDLSTSGKTEKEAKKRFGEASFLFIEELEKGGTLHEVLRELGWRRAHKQWSPPKIVSQEVIGVRMPVSA